VNQKIKLLSFFNKWVVTSIILLDILTYGVHVMYMIDNNLLYHIFIKKKQENLKRNFILLLKLLNTALRHNTSISSITSRGLLCVFPHDLFLVSLSTPLKVSTLNPKVFVPGILI